MTSDSSQYQQQLDDKVKRLCALLPEIKPDHLEVFASPIEGYRMRAEFRFWHEGDDSYYVMFPKGQSRNPYRVDHFPAATPIIQDAMPRLREAVLASEALRHKLFQVDFLGTRRGELLISLLYHRPLNDEWQAGANQLAQSLGASIIGRSRKQKIILQRDYVEDDFTVDGITLRYRQYENAFSQPNAWINEAMLNWASAQCAYHNQQSGHGPKADLLELYCGNGNFSFALAPHFHRVLATELDKAGIRAAKANAEMNGIDNVELVRMSAEDIAAALAKVRPFRRLANIELTEFNFTTVFVDPPRSGLDARAIEQIRQFDRILYISCNPETLTQNIDALRTTHKIEEYALFDQFPFTEHIESGVVLQRIS